MEEDLEYRHQLLEEHRQAAEPLFRYLPWLEANRGQQGSTLTRGTNTNENAMQFPVYDSTLLSFVREASKSVLMDRNYRYLYTRNNIKTPEEERRLIASAELEDWDALRGILSKYVLGGRTKGTLWSDGVKENIFYLVLTKMKEIIEFWD